MFLFLQNAMPPLISSSAQPSPSFHYAWYGGTGFLGVGHPGHLVHTLARSLFSVSGYHSKLFTCKSGVPLSRTDLYPNKLVSEYQSLHQLHFLRRQKF